MSGTHSPKTERSKSGTSRKIMFEIVVILALVTVLGFCTVLWLAGDSVEGLLSHLLTRDEQVL
ncbi:MAG: hypothetical protein IJQ21_10275, partial [Lachnospiraceae bacterium]|nr:hypothetical protein [Lachnospiraceae bacterium]